MVSSKHDYPVRGVDFEGVEVQQTLGVDVCRLEVSMISGREGTHLNSKVSSINIVSQEQIHTILQRTAHFEHLHQVILQISTLQRLVSKPGAGTRPLTYWPWISPQTVDPLARSKTEQCVEERRTGDRALE